MSAPDGAPACWTISSFGKMLLQQEVDNMFAGKLLFAIPLSIMLGSTIGCGGGSPDCGPSGLNVAPSSATVNHVAAPPGNSQVFSASFQFKINPGCPAITAALVNSNWTASDPSVQLSAPQAIHVTATCTAGVALPVTISATPVSGEMFTGKASLTCN